MADYEVFVESLTLAEGHHVILERSRQRHLQLWGREHNTFMGKARRNGGSTGTSDRGATKEALRAPLEKKKELSQLGKEDGGIDILEG